MKRVFIKLLCLLWALLLVAGCASSSPKDEGSVKEGLPLPENGDKAVEVVATIFPLADIAGNLGGGRVKTTYLLPSGASPHTYEPTVEQAKAVASADLFLFVGGGLDNWVLDLPEGEKVPALEITANMEEYLLGSDEGAGQDSHLHGRSHSSYDPHVWTDPLLVKEIIAPLITKELKAVDPEAAAVYDNALENYQAELEELHQEVVAAAGTFSKKKYISYHSAWNYFARRYGLEEVAAVEPFPGKEPSAGWLAQLVRLAEEHRINILFAEPQLNPKVAEIIAEEIKGRVLILDPLGGEGVPGRDSYTGLIRYNVEIFREALE
ncbi:MAG: zinc ABC transporter substrate-binding protein [Firmicutes bacterium]|nr:zinc ABC transporter substrate-binding protein [Bacillota bacterium]